MIEDSEPLPPLYANWLVELLGDRIPRESQASCDSCAMCSANRATAGYYFDPSVKCCTFVPNLHNFLVGRILSDDDPAARPGRMTVEKRIKEGIAVTPLGLGRSPAYAVLYDNSQGAFGRSRNLRCPHYIEDGGRCGIWRNRESTCATWFCKHIRGDIGIGFWRSSVFQLLRVVETQLARWCVSAQFSDDALRELVKSPSWTGRPGPVTAESMDSRIEEKSYARIWDEWRGRETDFFIQCAKSVMDLSWSDVLAISGPQAQVYARLTKQAYSRLTSEELPPRLKAGVFSVMQIENGKTRIKTTLNEFDPIDVSNEVMELLQYFDGRPTEEVLDAIVKEKKLRLGHSLVRKLFDFGVLVPL